MTEARSALHPSAFLFFLSDCRVSPGECGFTSSDGNPGTNGVITKLAAEGGIKSKPTILQATSFSDNLAARERSALGHLDCARRGASDWPDAKWTAGDL